MTQRKRLVLFAWGLLVLLLAGMGITSRQFTDQIPCVQLSFLHSDYAAGLGAGSLKLIYEHEPKVGSAFAVSIDAAGFAMPPDLGWIYRDESFGIISLPMWLLILAVTLPFTLLYLLIHRRQARREVRLQAATNPNNQ